MRFSISQLLALTFAIASQLAMACAVGIWQTLATSVAAAIALAVFQWSIAVPSQQTADSASSLPYPWLVFGVGFVLMIIGFYFAFPRACELTEQQYQQALSRGYQAHDGEYTLLRARVAILHYLIGFPLVLIVLAAGAKCSGKFNVRGIGRYAAGYVLAILPLLACTISFMNYWYINFRLGDV